jgi:prepilin-type N-terminal cleavage/methylation domain-containing protein
LIRPLSNKEKREEGFTLVEALVAMLVFSIGFTGLYFFFSISQKAIVLSEKRMHLNLMADRILQTIESEARRDPADPLNPFVNQSIYAGNIANCGFNSSDIRQIWCLDMNSNIGPLNPASGKEIRQVDLLMDSGNLIVNVSLVSEGGKVSSYFTRKIRP